LGLLHSERFHREIEDHVKSCRRLSVLLNTAPLWGRNVSIENAQVLAQSVLTIAAEMADLWEASRQRLIAKMMKEEARQRGKRSSLGFASSMPADVAATHSRSDVQVSL